MLYQSLNVIYMLIVRNPDVGSVWVQKVIAKITVLDSAWACVNDLRIPLYIMMQKKCYLEDKRQKLKVYNDV